MPTTQRRKPYIAPGTGVLVIGCWLGFASCRQATPVQETSNAMTPPTIEDLRHGSPEDSVVLYFGPTPITAPLPEMQRLMPTALAGVHLWQTPIQPPQEAWPKEPFLAYSEESAPMETVPVPDVNHLTRHGFGMDRAMCEAVQRSSMASRLVLRDVPGSARSNALRFTRLVHELADRTGAVIWDSTTFQCFAPSAWKAHRLDTWTADGLPDVSQFLFVDAYLPDPQSPFGRAHTMGMRRFALPDLVVEEVLQRHVPAVRTLLRLVAQALVEQPEIQSAADIAFSIAAIRSASVRQELTSQLGMGGTGTIRMQLRDLEPQPGDPRNKLLELDFGFGVGRTALERKEDLLTRFLGVTRETFVEATITPEIEAASKKAREHLLSWGRDYTKRLPEGSILMAKGPFASDDGQEMEWMWIEVHGWNDSDELEGVLANEPVHARRFRAGSTVKFPVGRTFDYEIIHPDGTREGNATGRLMTKPQPAPGAGGQ